MVGLTPMPILPCEVQTISSRLGWGSGQARRPRWRQSARPPETHNALAPSQKHQHSLLTMSPLTTRPCPPLPGKSDGGEVVGQLQHHLALCGRPGRGPERSLAPCADRSSGTCAGQQHILILTASASCEAVESPLWAGASLTSDDMGNRGQWVTLGGRAVICHYPA